MGFRHASQFGADGAPCSWSGAWWSPMKTMLRPAAPDRYLCAVEANTFSPKTFRLLSHAAFLWGVCLRSLYPLTKGQRGGPSHRRARRYSATNEIKGLTQGWGLRGAKGVQWRSRAVTQCGRRPLSRRRRRALLMTRSHRLLSWRSPARTARVGERVGWKTYARLSPLTLVDLGKLRTVKLSGGTPNTKGRPQRFRRLQTIR